MEQKSFLLFLFEFSAKFYAPPEFSGGVPEKYLSTGWAQSFGIPTMYSIIAPLHPCFRFCDIHTVTCWDFPAVSVVTGRNFPAVAVTTGRDFPALSVVTGRDFPAYL